jgi:hypothetical protein
MAGQTIRASWERSAQTVIVKSIADGPSINERLQIAVSSKEESLEPPTN